MSAELERYYTASSFTMMWWRFRRHRIALVSGCVLLAAYIAILFVEQIAPYGLDKRNTDFIYAPPQGIHLFHEGSFVGPFVYPMKYRLDMETLKREYTPDTTKPQRIGMFCSGDPYKWLGLISPASICSARRKTAPCSCSALIG